MNRISQLRKEKGLNQVGLAMLLNVSQYTISAIETGRQQPTSELLIALANYFNVSVDYILERSEIKHLADHTVLDKLSVNEVKLLSIFRELDEAKQNQAIGVVFSLKNL